MRFRRVAGVGLALCLGSIGGAYAQSMLGEAQQDNAVAVPPAPPVVAAPLSPPAPTVIIPAAPPPPGLVQTPVPPPDADMGSAVPPPAPMTPPPDEDTGAAPAPGATPVAPATPAPPAPAWVPGTTAELGVLAKIDGSTTDVSIPVGGQKDVGDLQVSVSACVIRPPGQIPDAAVFLVAQSQKTGAEPTYRGWMVRSVPGAAEVGDSSETFRIIGCS